MADKLLAAITAARARQDASATALRVAVQRAREAGCTWEAIGQALGVTKQTAQKRFRQP